MALVEAARKGGRYTKKEQEERKIQVFHLHFEENRSAVKIAQLLGVNRNTINDDIAYWHSQFVSEMNGENLAASMTKQIQRMEIQRDRLMDLLEEAEDIDEKIRIEKFVSDIGYKLMQYYSKMVKNQKVEKSVKMEEIDENEIKECVRKLTLDDKPILNEDVISENDLKFYFIKKTKCDVAHADLILDKMKHFGLLLCQQHRMKENYLTVISHDYSLTYNLEKFALMRGYVTTDELGNIMKKERELEKEIEKEEREERLVEKYGEDKSKWPSDAQNTKDDQLEIGR